MKTLTQNEKIAVAVAIVAALAIFVLFAPNVIGSLFVANSNQGTLSAPVVSTDTSKSLKVQDVVVGTGAEAQTGDAVQVKYIGKLMDGSVFDSTDAHGGKPIEFKLGVGQVIKGWDLGLVGMKVGGKRALLIAPELGYGAQVVGPIPANSTLYFEVELVGVNSAQ
jgi:FKBP-type peptidyl-prolyl cis-trans isomerase